MAKAEFSRQGRYLWSLIKQAKWDHYKKLTAAEKKKYGEQIRYKRYELYFMHTFKATHIEALTETEIRRAIATIKPYADKENARAGQDKQKQLRKQIVSAVIGSKHTVPWLHENMQAWGFGDSLRALDVPQLCELCGTLAKALGRVV